jgi:hypothetical protein
MIKKVYIFILILLLLSCSNNIYKKTLKGNYELINKTINNNLSQNQAELFGVVKDMSSGNIIDGAIISMDGLELGSISNDDGFFFLIIPSGNYNIIVQSVGNSELRTRKIRLKEKESVELNFYLGKELIP